MKNNETEFAKLVSRLKLDDRPTESHRESVRRQMLAEFNRIAAKKDSATDGLHRIWRTIMESRLTKAAVAAIVIVAILIGIGKLAGNNDTKPIIVKDTPTLEEKIDINMPSIDVKLTEKLAIEAKLADELYAAGDIDGLIAMLETGELPSKVLVANYLADLGADEAFETIEKLANDWTGDGGNPFDAAVEKIEQSAVESSVQDDPAGLADGEAEEDEKLAAGVKENTFELEVVNKATGELISGVRLDVLLNQENFIETTGADGKCLIEIGEDVPEYFRVRVQKAGFVAMGLYYQIHGSDLRVPEKYRLELEEGTVIGGVIKNQQEEPISGVKVRLDVYSNDQMAIEKLDLQNVAIVTDDQGRWQCDMVPADTLNISVDLEHTEYVATKKNISTPTIDLYRSQKAVRYMRRGLTVAGRVMNGEGNGIGDASVYQGLNAFMHSPDTKTDANGFYKFEKSKPDSMTLAIVAKGYAQDTKTIDVNDQMSAVDFYLEPGYSLTIRAVDADGINLEGVIVEARKWRVGGKWNQRLENIRGIEHTDRNGVAVLTEMPHDEVLYNIYKEGYAAIRNVPMMPSDDEQVVVLYRPGKLVGGVTDAVTGEKVETFNVVTGIQWSDDDSVTWQRLAGSHSSKDGRYEQLFNTQTDGYSVKIVADGYMPFESPVFYNDSREIVYDIELMPANDVIGVAYLENGKPAENIDVVLSTENKHVTVTGKKWQQFNGKLNFKTDSDGQFKLPPLLEDYRVLAISDYGIAEVSKQQLIETGEVRMERWGRLEGVLYTGNEHGANQQITVSRENKRFKNPRVQYTNSITTDDKGRFTFKYIEPGKIGVSRLIKTSEGSWATSNYTKTEVVGGEATFVEIGGGGVTVVGRFIIPQGYEEIINLSTDTPRIETKPEIRPKQPEIDVPDNYLLMGMEEKMEWFKEWQKGDVGKKHMAIMKDFNQARNNKSYPVQIGEDRSFKAEDVTAGSYILTSRCYEAKHGTHNFETLTSLTKFEFEITEDDVVNEKDAVVDIGEVMVEPTKKVFRGQVVPDFGFTDLTGKKMKLSNLRGKFVLLDMGGVTRKFDAVNQMDHLKDVQNALRESEDFTLVSVNLTSGFSTEDIVRTLKFFVEDQGIGWIMGIVETSSEGRNNQLTEKFGISLFPSLILIGPDGIILKMDIGEIDVDGDGLVEAINRAMSE